MPRPTTLAPLPSSTRASRLNQLRPGGLSRGAAFVAIAAILVLFLAASAAPSPLYVVYQADWGFSAITLTGIFAIYVFGLLGSLLVFGALSDHIGRRRVLGAAIALETVALVLFLVAGDVGVVAGARFLQGIATGAAMTTLSAALIDLTPEHAPGRAGVVNSVAPLAGLATGALACGALVQFGPSPTHLVYAILLAGMLLAAIAVLLAPETSARRPGARSSLRPRVALPARLRADFLAITPVLLASWAVGGLYLSLGPSVAAGEFGLSNHLIGGLVVTLLCGTGAIAAFGLQGRPPQHLLLTAGTLLTVGMLITLAAIDTGPAWLAAAGTVVAGVGFGAAALGAFGTLARIALPNERGELFAVALVLSYLAFSVPALAAGLASTRYGLHPTVLVYGAVVVALSVSALGAQRILARRPPAVAG